MLVDSHCHLDFPDFLGRLDEVIARAEQNGVGGLVTISTHVARADTYRALSEAHPQVAFTIGTHPHNAGEADERTVTAEELAALAEHPKVVAIGEAGLDYHYDKAPRADQQDGLRRHIAAARITGLPLIVHARDADADMAAILTEEFEAGAFPAVLHCFSSGRRLAEVGVELGFSVSFSGILTFRRSEELRAIARAVPPERLLVETDAPYLSPRAVRSKRNEPKYVVHTARFVAERIGMRAEEFGALTSRNARDVFGLPVEV